MGAECISKLNFKMDTFHKKGPCKGAFFIILQTLEIIPSYQTLPMGCLPPAPSSLFEPGGDG